MNILDFATSAAGGGLFGFVGQLANRGIGLMEAKQKREDQLLANAHEKERWANEKDLLRLQMEQGAAVAADTLEQTNAAGGWAGFNASMAADAVQQPSYRWVAAVRTLTRPFLTLESQIALVVLLFVGRAKPDILSTVTDTIVFCASASLLWWFGERAQRPRGQK